MADDFMTVESDSGIEHVAADLEALRARIDVAKADAEARAQATATEAHGITTPPPRGQGRPPWRRNLALALALALILLAIALTAIISGGNGPEPRVSDPPAVTDAATAVEPAPPDGANGPAISPDAEVASDGVLPSAGLTGADPPVPQPPDVTAPKATMPDGATPAATEPDAGTTVVVEIGDSLWSIADRRVESARGSPPTTAEVAAYWADLIEANQDRLAHASNPDLIYPGQTFSLP